MPKNLKPPAIGYHDKPEEYSIVQPSFIYNDNEIVIIDEFLSRNTYGKAGQFEARQATAIKELYERQESIRKAEEKAVGGEEI